MRFCLPPIRRYAPSVLGPFNCWHFSIQFPAFEHSLNSLSLSLRLILLELCCRRDNITNPMRKR